MTNTTTSPKGSKASTTNGNGSSAAAEDRFASYEEYQALGSVSADGFWNIPMEKAESAKVVGEKLVGILLAEVRTKKDGKAIDNPFYVFELTEDHHRCTGTGDQKGKTITLKKGQRVGVSAGWTDLQNLGRKMGHEICLQFLGKESLGTTGRVKNKIKVLNSPKPLRHIESINPQKAEEGDKGGQGEEVPF